jgi:histidinol-phosphatase
LDAQNLTLFSGRAHPELAQSIARHLGVPDGRINVGHFSDGESSIEAAHLSAGNLRSLAKSDAWARLGSVVTRLNRFRGYGDFYHYHQLAAGQLDAVIESDVNILDIAALTEIVREAGGVFTDLAGAAVGLETTSVLAAPAALHTALLAEIAWKPA